MYYIRNIIKTYLVFGIFAFYCGLSLLLALPFFSYCLPPFRVRGKKWHAQYFVQLIKKKRIVSFRKWLNSLWLSSFFIFFVVWFCYLFVSWIIRYWIELSGIFYLISVALFYGYKWFVRGLQRIRSVTAADAKVFWLPQITSTTAVVKHCCKKFVMKCCGEALLQEIRNETASNLPCCQSVFFCIQHSLTLAAELFYSLLTFDSSQQCLVTSNRLWILKSHAAVKQCHMTANWRLGSVQKWRIYSASNGRTDVFFQYAPWNCDSQNPYFTEVLLVRKISIKYIALQGADNLAKHITTGKKSVKYAAFRTISRWYVAKIYVNLTFQKQIYVTKRFICPTGFGNNNGIFRFVQNMYDS